MTLESPPPGPAMPRPDDGYHTSPFLVVVDAGADGTTTVRPRGECDLCTSPHLSVALAELLAAATPRVVLDLDAVTFIDASGLGVIATMAGAFDTAGLSLVVRCHEDNILKLFRICRLQDLLRNET